jgi:hypothetical protein
MISGRRHSWLGRLLLLTLLVGLLPMYKASADLTFPLSKEETDRVFQEWYAKSHGGAGPKGAMLAERAIANRLILESPQLSATEMTARLDALDANYYKLLGPRGADPEYRQSLPLGRITRAFYTAALQTPGFEEKIGTVYAELKLTLEDHLRLGQVIPESSLPVYKALTDEHALSGAIGALFDDTIDQSLLRAETDSEFATTWVKHFAPSSDGSILNFDTRSFLAQHPELSIPRPLRDAVRPDGTMEVSLVELEQLARGEFAKINTSIDGMQKTLVDLSRQQGELVDFMNDQKARQAAQDKAEAEARAHQLKLQAANSAVSIIATLASVKYPERGRQISVIGQSLIKVGDSLSGWMKATAGLNAMSKLGSLSTVVMTGNVLSAVMSVISLFGPQQPTPEQMILEEIGKLRQQVSELRTEMHARFDQIDRELNAIYASMNARFDQIDIKLGKISGSLAEIQESLLNLSMALNRMERNNTEYLDALGRRPLSEAINGALGYRERTGVAMLYQPDFVNYENFFHTWGTINAFDSLSAGPSQRDYSDGQVLAELSAAPLDANLNYLNGWLQAHGLQPFTNHRLPSPRDWAFASRAYAQLGQDWPEHLRRIDPERRAALDAVGADLQQALQNISTIQTPAGPQGNGPLFNALNAYYDSKLQALDGGLAASEATFVADVQAQRSRAVPFDLYGGLDQSLAPPYRPDDFSTMTCGGSGAEASRLPAPRHLSNMIASYNRFALADYLGLNPLKVCVYAGWSSYDPPCVGGPGTCARFGELRVAIHVFSNDTRLMLFYINGPRREYSDASVWELIAPEWNSYWKRSFELYFANQPTPPPLSGPAAQQLTTVSDALTSKLADLQRSYGVRVQSELGRGPLQARAVELAGAKKLLESFTTLGLSQALESDDFLRSLLFSKEALLDDQQIAGFYTPPAATQALSPADLMLNPRLQLRQVAQKRHAAIGSVLNDYLGGISTEAYAEDSALVGGARFDLLMAGASTGSNGPLPGQGQMVFLPLARR